MRQKYITTAAYYLAFIFLGLTVAADGPALLKLAEHTSSTLDQISLIFIFGSLGYLRGSMTLEALRQKVGTHDFFVILRSWAKQHKYGNVTTAQFIRLSERVSGQDLDGLFSEWLCVPERPTLS